MSACGRSNKAISVGTRSALIDCPLVPHGEFSMKALTWHGTRDVRIDSHPDPRIEESGDVIVKVTATAICGSDLHIFDGFIAQMKSGDILGHEFMGEVVETGAAVRNLKKG